MQSTTLSNMQNKQHNSALSMIGSAKPLLVAAAAGALLFGHSATAAVNAFTEDFEGIYLATPDGTDSNGTGLPDLATSGWSVFGNVADGSGNPKFGYGPFGAPNKTGAPGPGFSAVATGDTDNSGNATQYLNIFSNYDCCGFGTTDEGHANGTDIVHSLVFLEFTIASSDIGKQIQFSFDAKRPDLQSDGEGGDTSAAVGNNCGVLCTAGAFVKTLDPSNGFAETNLLQEDMTNTSQSTWTRYTITLDLTDPLLDGQLLQLGFENFASDFDNSGVYYDNLELVVNTVAEPAVNVPVPALAVLTLGGLLAAGVAVRRRSTIS